ncbi:MAG: hypothetical protein JSS22_07615 [Proteobacteria bacterium]|nr:hypothetical protein [Pseudomonadota bacterium]
MRTYFSRFIIAGWAMVLMMALGLAAAHAANLGEACGGGAGIKCNALLWCQMQAGQCKAADAAGQCDKAPTFCMRMSRPVCGCNGKTYANDCERQRAKVQLDHTGACPKEPGATPPKSKPSKPRKKKHG